MTPKQKAEELVEQYIPHAVYWDCYNDTYLEVNHAKQCALIDISNTIAEAKRWKGSYMGSGQYEELLEIKQEIKKL